MPKASVANQESFLVALSESRKTIIVSGIGCHTFFAGKHSMKNLLPLLITAFLFVAVLGCGSSEPVVIEQPEAPEGQVLGPDGEPGWTESEDTED